MKRILFIGAFVFTIALLSLPAFADGPKDNSATTVRPIPPVGPKLDDQTRRKLQERCQRIRSNWEKLVNGSGDQRSLEDLRPEVLVFPRAVEMSIEFDQFYKPNLIRAAEDLLSQAQRRIDTIAGGGNWADVVGIGDGSALRLIVGGFRSKIDGSFQPYSAVIPAGLTSHDCRPRRLDIWFHGRGETLSEVNFLSNQQRNPGQYTPADTIVLHPYGRYSNAFKFAGEVDVLEGLEYLKSRLPVDEKRISVRGFSMGGAACWQFATHYADRWFAANPGAGFSETPEFLRTFQGEDVAKTAPEYQQIMWRLYDCPPWVENLRHCPTIAYSGEIDRQKQAADVMETAFRQLKIDMVHVIGPDTAHKIHPDSKRRIETSMDSIATNASRELPRIVKLTTYTLRYNRMHWIQLHGMDRHWEEATVSANIDSSGRIHVFTKNANRIRIHFEPGQFPGRLPRSIQITVNEAGRRAKGHAESIYVRPRSDRSLTVDLAATGSAEDRSWAVVGSDNDESLRKRPGLQGPIDDAFMDSFVFVLPSGRSNDPIAQGWYETESRHAMTHWRKHFRGDIRNIKDTEVTDQMIADSNLVLFGDVDSNAVIKRIADDLPLRRTDDRISIGPATHPAPGRVAILVHPNPLNTDRYVVLNSGFTFREYDYLNNARQAPKLPDWAIVDVREGATTQDPGRIESAGFFDESWKP